MQMVSPQNALVSTKSSIGFLWCRNRDSLLPCMQTAKKPNNNGKEVEWSCAVSNHTVSQTSHKRETFHKIKERQQQGELWSLDIHNIDGSDWSQATEDKRMVQSFRYQ